MGPRNGLRIQECRLRVCRFISKPASSTDGEAWISQFAPTSTAGLVSVAQDSKPETQMFYYCSFVTFTKYFVQIAMETQSEKLHVPKDCRAKRVTSCLAFRATRHPDAGRLLSDVPGV